MNTPRIDSVDDVEARGRSSLAALFALIEGAGFEERSLGDAYLGRRGADVVAHLHGWHELYAGWCEAHFSGEPVEVPAAGHSWDALDALNDEIYARYAGFAYEELTGLARRSREAMFVQLRRFDERDATTPGAVPWTPMTLVELADECGAIHDEWAAGRIRAALGDD